MLWPAYRTIVLLSPNGYQWTANHPPGRNRCVLSASVKCRNNVHEKNFHDGHSRKDHGVDDVRSVRWRKLIRVSENRRVAAGARDNPRYLIIRPAENKKTEDQNWRHQRDQHNRAQS